jgi:hypothetical protein
MREWNSDGMKAVWPSMKTMTQTSLPIHRFRASCVPMKISTGSGTSMAPGSCTGTGTGTSGVPAEGRRAGTEAAERCGT